MGKINGWCLGWREIAVPKSKPFFVTHILRQTNFDNS